MNDIDNIRRGASSFDELATWCRLSAIHRNKRYPCIPMMKISRGQTVFPSNAECIRCAHRMYQNHRLDHLLDPLRAGWLRIYGVNKNDLSIRTRVPVPDVKLARQDIVYSDRSCGIINWSKGEKNTWHTGMHWHESRLNSNDELI